MTARRKMSPILLTPLGVLLGAFLFLALAAGPFPDFGSNRTPGPAGPVIIDNGFDLRGGTDINSNGVLLELGAGWIPFTWYGTGPVFDREGPFILDVNDPVTLRITDDYCGGDRFRVFIDDVEFAETFSTAKAGGSEHGANATFSDRTWSSGIYSLATLESGRHEIRIQAANNPWGMGRAFLRVDPEHTFSSLVAEEVATNFRAIHGTDRFRFQTTIALAAGSDGILPNFEDVVISYGRYLEVIPAGSFVCGAVDCVYTSASPGVQRAVIQPNAVIIEGVDVDLCPAANPLVIGVWIGNDGASLRMRCKGALHE